ncbi:MAG: PrsW family intramembrane metalloprotease [Candidatus Bipolaricaulis sp.]|nr:PrsW family intramembrane metalloprotease [Candidatus Bipolaricaulis sp.]
MLRSDSAQGRCSSPSPSGEGRGGHPSRGRRCLHGPPDRVLARLLLYAGRAPRAALVQTFFLGTATTLAAAVIEFILIAVEGRSLGVLAGAAYEAFAVAALAEELLKLLVIACFCARRRSFDEPMDGIVYGATAALGFAATENAMYVAQGGWIVAVMRSVTSVPMHAAMGAILGYYVAQERLLLRRGAIWSGLAIAVLVHGLYDLGPMVLVRLGADGESLAGMGSLSLGFLILFVAVVVTTLVALRHLVKRLRAEQLRSRASEADGVSRRRPADAGDPLIARLLERRAQDAEASSPSDGMHATREANAERDARSEGLPNSDPVPTRDGDRPAA